jgi:natural product biosynthesis luciferase-like monooxygenase protein
VTVNKNLIDLIRARAERDPELLLYSYASESGPQALSACDLVAKSLALGRHLHELGMRGERVAIICTPGLAPIIGFFSCLFAGAIAVPLPRPNKAGKGARIKAVFEDCAPGAVLGCGQKEDPDLTTSARGSKIPWLMLGDVDRPSAGSWDYPEPDGSSLAFLQYTSGSTGRPRGVMVSHNNALENAAEMEEAFGISQADRGVFWLPFYHDMGLIGGMIQPAYSGYSTTIMSPQAFVQEPLLWLRAISETRATLSGGPNFAYDHCVQQVDDKVLPELDLSSWRVAFNGSETVRHGTMQAFASKFASSRFDRKAFRPCYGLAETTLLVSALDSSIDSVVNVDADALRLKRVSVVGDCTGSSKQVVGAGKVGSRNSVAIVDPESFKTCAEEQVGEIWITGASVAQGYWNKPVQTKRSFEARCHEDRARRYLRTGDLGFLRNGELFVVGRLKDLIIIRGQNIYPEDIEETATRSHPALHRGRGAAFSIDAHDGERLIVVHECRKAEGAAAADAASRIREQVAIEHQVQVNSVVLIRIHTLPRTTSGKVQRKACREAFLDGRLNVIYTSSDSHEVGIDRVRGEVVRGDSRRPASALELLVSAIVMTLGVPAADIKGDTKLSAFGIDSLRASQLKIAIEKSIGICPPLSYLLQAESIIDLAQWIEEHREKTYEPSKEEAKGLRARYPLSAGQKALWYLQQLEPLTPAYTIARLFRIRGPLNTDKFRESFVHLVRRHPSLRTIAGVDDGELVQTVSDPKIDFETIESQGWDDNQIAEAASEAAGQPFDLGLGPVLRIRVYRCSENDATILFVAHHIALDLWSLVQLIEELGTVYSAVKRGSAPILPDLENNYCEFVDWQAHLLTSAEHRILSDYWWPRMKNLPAPMVLSKFSTGAEIHRSANHHFQIESQHTAELAAFSQANNVTLHGLLISAFQVLLFRYSGRTEFLMGLLSSGRNRKCTEDVVGYFVNLLVLRPDLTANPSFSNFLRKSYTELLDALDHQDMPFSVLMEQVQADRNASRSPLIQVACILQTAKLRNRDGLGPFILGQAGGTFAIDDLECESKDFSENATQFDLALAICENDGMISGVFKYDPERFEPQFIARFARHYCVLLRSILENPDAGIGVLELFTKAERTQITRTWNNTARRVRSDVCIHTLIEEQASRTPDNPAITFDVSHLSYGELDATAEKLARHLRQVGVRPESRVALYVQRSREVVVAILAILKAGGAYVPLDPSHPVQRIESILEASGALLLLTTGALAGRIKVPSGMRTVCLDRLEWESDAADDCSAHQSLPQNLAYVMFTSGSTGKPKGVMIEHRSVVNFFHAMDEKVGCGPGDSVLAVTGVSFDISILELLWPLTRGSHVVVAAEHAIYGSSGRKPVCRPSKDIRFSLFYFASTDAEDAGEPYRMLIEGAKLADQLGLLAVWTPERHFHAFGGIYPNPSLTSSALAMLTSRVQLRAGSVVLPLHDPIRVAEEWAVVDQMSNGRVGIAFATGWHADDFVLAPTNYATRKELTLHGIETVRQLWRGGSVSRAGGAGNTIEITIHPHPVQRELPVWLTSSGSAETFRSATKCGANVLTHLLGQDMREVAEKISLYRSGLAEEGFDPAGGIVTLMLHTYIDEDLSRAGRKAVKPFKNYLRSSVGLISNLVRSMKLDVDLTSMKEDDLDDLLNFAAERYMGESGLFGTIESCANMVERVREIGANEIACLVDFGVDFESTMQSIRRIAELQDRLNRSSIPNENAEHSQPLESGPTILQCTPSMMRVLLESGRATDLLSSLRVLLLGGEAVPLPLVQSLCEVYHGPLFNMYGPTETTIWSSAQALDPLEDKVLIGGPLVNTQLYLLAGDLELSPVGTNGELYIGGNGLARGYLDDPVLTAERFVPDPFSEIPGARIYRTGDAGRLQKDSRIELAGRVDEQVKIRGHRIELGDVDATLNRAPGVRIGVTTSSGKSGEEELVAYLVPSSGELSVQDVRAYLLKHLPAYMVPSKLNVVDTLSLTPNGKIDRKSLARILVQPRPAWGSPLTPATNGVQDIVLLVWKEVLKIDAFSVDDNFFDIGGHSLLMVQVHERLQSRLQKSFPLITLLQHPTIRSVTAFLGSASQGGVVPHAERATLQRTALLSQRERALAVRAQK